MSTATRVFIDYWNFAIQWSHQKVPKNSCDWRKLPQTLINAAEAAAPQLGQLRLDDTRVYASCNSQTEAGLRKWLNNFLDRQPGFRVFVRERHARKAPVRCRMCKHQVAACPDCGADYEKAVEKGTDTAIVTDIFSLAWEEAYDVAILVSGDADLIPAVEKIQDRGLKVVNASWKNHGFELAKTCWASFQIDPLVPQLVRQP